MAHLNVDQADFESEREVVKEEYRQRVLRLDPIDGGDVFYVPSNVLVTISPSGTAAVTGSTEPKALKAIKE